MKQYPVCTFLSSKNGLFRIKIFLILRDLKDRCNFLMFNKLDVL